MLIKVKIEYEDGIETITGDEVLGVVFKEDIDGGVSAKYVSIGGSTLEVYSELLGVLGGQIVNTLINSYDLAPQEASHLISTQFGRGIHKYIDNNYGDFSKKVISNVVDELKK